MLWSVFLSHFNFRVRYPCNFIPQNNTAGGLCKFSPAEMFYINLSA